jgi:hypothetical protein
MASNQFKVRGDELLKKVKELIREGNVRRIIIKNEKRETFMEIPISVGVLGAIFAPVLVAIGAIAAMASSFTLEVIRKEKASKLKPSGKK